MSEQGLPAHDPRALLQRYGPRGFLRLVGGVTLATTLRLRFGWQARIVRRPAFVRGGKGITVGRNFTAGVGLRIDSFGPPGLKTIEIGDDVQVNDYVHIAAVERVTIGAGTLIASRVFISDHTHGSYGVAGMPHDDPKIPPARRSLFSAPTQIGGNCLIGEGAAILAGVTLGDGAIVGANSVVTRSVPANTIVVGSPARCVRSWDDASQQWVDRPGR